MSKSLTFISLLLALIVSTVVSYKTGAGGCTGGKVAVGGSHLTAKKVLSRKLSDKGVKVSVGGVTIAAGSTGVVAYGKTQTITITGSNMKGVLIRMQAPSGVSTKNLLVAGSGLKSAPVCKSPVAGVTHKAYKASSSYTSTVKFPASTKGVIFDISIVYENESSEAEHAYGRVKVDFTKKARL